MNLLLSRVIHGVTFCGDRISSFMQSLICYSEDGVLTEGSNEHRRKTIPFSDMLYLEIWAALSPTLPPPISYTEVSTKAFDHLLETKVTNDQLSTLETKVTNDQLSTLETKVTNDQLSTLGTKVTNDQLSTLGTKVTNDQLSILETKVTNDQLSTLETKVTND